MLQPRARIIKRILDIPVALILLLVALPFMLFIALAIRVETRGPVFFVHTRIGRHGRRFRLWKLRTMVTDADQRLAHYLDQHPELRAEWQATHKLKDDPRVTRVGRVLRRSSLDEIPQLWNVLRGDMSMVGPRPIVEAETPRYGAVLDLYLAVLPGLTGLWQVSGRTDTSYQHRIQLDTDYIRNWSPWLDLRVLLQTVRVVLLGHGAY